jgi:hypothetical protein
LLARCGQRRGGAAGLEGRAQGVARGRGVTAWRGSAEGGRRQGKERKGRKKEEKKRKIKKEKRKREKRKREIGRGKEIEKWERK